MARTPEFRAWTDDELIVDSFAGGGGASMGIEMALGRSPDIAINHDAEAIALHAANHPASKHYREDVWKVDPREATQGKPVGLMWLSPDCKHFSKAKGGKPVSKKVRGLAWVAVRWAKAVQPRVIVLENVEEFQTWGPVDRTTNRPDPSRKGLTFRRFCGRLRNLGYEVQHRELRGCDFGAPTIRKRLFLIARCDGQPIVWPKPTHAKQPYGELRPWRTAAECIDWSIPCPSIFERAKPLAVNTQKRIARGVQKYVLDTAKPFIVSYYSPKRDGDHRVADVNAPLPTQSTENRFGVAVPFFTEHANASNQRNMPVDEPLRTQCAQVKGGHFALVAPPLIQTGYGEREGQEPRVPGLDKPLGTVVAGGQKHALVSAFLAKHYGERKDGETMAASLFDPAPTVTATDHSALVAVTLGEDHRDDVRAFLVAYFGNEKDGGDLFTPMRTVTSRDRFGLVTVSGREYVIADIGMRMLVPRELYRAQGFPESYQIEIAYNGKTLSKSAQVRMCGNSVVPPLAAAIVRANYVAPERAEVAA